MVVRVVVRVVVVWLMVCCPQTSCPRNSLAAMRPHELGVEVAGVVADPLSKRDAGAPWDAQVSD